MTSKEILKDLKANGIESYKNTLLKHGAKEPFYGVKIEYMKSAFVKKIKKNHELSLELYDSGISDAMYLAGLIADEKKITKKQLRHWADKAHWHMMAEYTVPWIAAESPYGWELGLEWIKSKKELVACAGWCALSNVIMLKDDKDLDLKKIKSFLEDIEKNIHKAPNRVRYTMNGFVIAVGCYITSLTATALATAKAIGPVKVEMGGTACKVPSVPEYVSKLKARGSLGKKKKMARC
ncbi:MAG: DNA alkylation repair protein [Bacteroidia bacterium]|nr:DNA alkylation repair protein [Bacteroidia bacterium]